MTAVHAEHHRVVFLFDVDNTLLDNDQIVRDLRSHLEHEFGLEQSECYWRLFEARRQEIGYADYLGALQQYRLEYPHHPRILQMSSFLIDYPFADRLYPKALEVIHHLRPAGPCVVLSDGDVVFQPRKVERSGILEAVNGQALIYIHKEHELEDVMRRFPADHYVMIDDKLRILAAFKTIWGSRVTTVFPRQGHYALDQKSLGLYPAADITVERIADLLERDPVSFGPRECFFT
jgi:FMN phosphatase YigB (HAD superfamily)